jgi:hypothetical protein
VILEPFTALATPFLREHVERCGVASLPGDWKWSFASCGMLLAIAPTEPADAPSMTRLQQTEAAPVLEQK